MGEEEALAPTTNPEEVTGGSYGLSILYFNISHISQSHFTSLSDIKFAYEMFDPVSRFPLGSLRDQEGTDVRYCFHVSNPTKTELSKKHFP